MSEFVLKKAPMGMVPQAVRSMLARAVAELVDSGYTESGGWLILNPSQTVLWLEEAGTPVAVLTYEAVEEWKKGWVALAYTAPSHRRRGCFKELLNDARDLAWRGKLQGVELATHHRNEGMQAAVRRAGMQQTFVRFFIPAHHTQPVG